MFYNFQKSADVSSFQNQGMALLWWVMSLRILRYLLDHTRKTTAKIDVSWNKGVDQST